MQEPANLYIEEQKIITVRFDFNAEALPREPNGEYHLYVNGRLVKRMTVWQAERFFGLAPA